MIDSGLGWICDDSFFCKEGILLKSDDVTVDVTNYNNITVEKENNISSIICFVVTDNNATRICYPVVISSNADALTQIYYKVDYVNGEYTSEFEPSVIISGTKSFRGITWYYKQYEAITADIADFELKFPTTLYEGDYIETILTNADVIGSSGGFIVDFYYNHSDADHLNKNITNKRRIFGELRNETSIISPVLRIQWNGAFNYNYCYIPIWNRYYYIKDPLSYRNNIIELSLEVDPLMSFKEDIRNLNAVINKQESQNINLYLDDGDWVMENKMFNQIYSFSQGFNQSGEFVLIVAGA